MKIIKSLILSLLLLTGASSIAQDKKQCTATTKAGTQCTRKTTGLFCKQHDPNGAKCGTLTKSGKPCMHSVKSAGTKCFQHNKQ